MANHRTQSLSFYDVMRRQRRKSFLLLIPLFLFYFLGIFLIIGGFFTLLNLYILQGMPSLFSVRFLSINLGIALFIALLHYWDARWFGAKFIRDRLGAKEPDPSDRYHQQFANLVEEMRISSGLPQVHCYVLPSLAINSMAQVESDGTPSVLVSEGMLAECTREELQSAIAHELSHILRGDAFYVTLVCSLTNLFERLRQELEPPPALTHREESGDNFLGRTFLSVLASIPEVILSFLSMLLSRQREILADASAVQLSRNPLALARVIYKAHLRHSFIGDFNASYTPLFIVSPESEGLSSSEGWIANLLSSHPPVMKRVDLLAEMAGKCRAQVIEQVWNIQKKREESRQIISSRKKQDFMTALKDQEQGEIQEAKDEYKNSDSNQAVSEWKIRDSHGDWQGPYSLEELLFLPFFSPLIKVKNEVDGIEAAAQDFPIILTALGNLRKRIPVDSKKQGKCPECKINLVEVSYEGLPILVCPECDGKLVKTDAVERILIRKEIGFSDDLKRKAQDFKQEFFVNPLKVKTGNTNQQAQHILHCPHCGSKMYRRPYSYSYFVQVDKCLACHQVWFERDQLEILQILIEEKQT